MDPAEPTAGHEPFTPADDEINLPVTHILVRQCGTERLEIDVNQLLRLCLQGFRKPFAD
ncbi:MAG TPA: hypothetical protein VM165_15330 [Planctomycetaceae bacterium]|nr:hypothetical protein [Planctomycetaceae bacterium]